MDSQSLEIEAKIDVTEGNFDSNYIFKEIYMSYRVRNTRRENIKWSLYNIYGDGLPMPYAILVQASVVEVETIRQNSRSISQLKNSSTYPKKPDKHLIKHLKKRRYVTRSFDSGDLDQDKRIDFKIKCKGVGYIQTYIQCSQKQQDLRRLEAIFRVPYLKRNPYRVTSLSL
ncbi:hypothetical protein EVAR_96454_1 [Eumeta japonica]|uniref:Uncharacterized protein n=1 Tax=Eumeta variegata TaxID=151549 RepID=A0A4C1VYP1_EUMVA|nr:hypothetical protein EVAR_96454_1 [Eumeta japonica]